jgi:hypothetical protein
MAVDHQAAAVEPVNQRPGDQPGGQGAEAVDRRDLPHPGDRIRRLQYKQRQGDQGDGVAEDGEGLPRPEDEEIAVVDQGVGLSRAAREAEGTAVHGGMPRR